MQQTSKKVGVWFCRGLLVLSLFLLPSAFLSTFVYSQPGTVKSILRQSGVYPAISKSIIDISASAIESIGTTYGLSKVQTNQVAQKAFPPSDIQKKFEKQVDQAYLWLNGKKPVFVFELDLENNKQKLIYGLSEELGRSIESKPICSTEQLQTLATQENQSSSILQTCRPSNLDVGAFKFDFAQALNAEQVPDAVSQAAASQVPVSSTTQQNGEPMFKLDNKVHGVSVPLVFWLFKNSFYIVVTLVVLFVSLLYALVRKPLDFTKTLAHPLLTTGILLVIYSLLTQWFIGQNFLSKLVDSQQAHLSEKTLQTFTSISARVVIYFGASYIVIAVALYIINRQLKKRQNEIKLVQEVTNANTVV